MSTRKPCEAHNIPADICARCKGAAEERERIIALIEMAMCHCEIDCDGGEIGEQSVSSLIDEIRGQK